MSTGSFRRFLQWPIRTLLAITGLVAIGMWLWLVLIEPYRLQARAHRTLVGKFELAPASPRFLEAVVGRNDFQRIVHFHAPLEATPQTLTPVADLKFLEGLTLEYTYADDSTAMRIRALPQLQHLNLCGTRITDRGLAHIAATCRKLRTLDLRDTCITNDGLSVLESLRSLKSLAIGGAIDGGGLSVVARIPHLETLDLRDSNVTWEDLRELSGSPISELTIPCDVPATELPHLLQLPNLRILRGRIANANNLAAEAIVRHGQLRELSVSGVEVTDATARSLLRLPLNCLSLEGSLTDSTLDHVAACSTLTRVNLTGRFSLDATRNLAKVRPELAGVIYTHEVTLRDVETGKGESSDREIESLGALSVHALSRSSGGYVTLRWPAAPQDIASNENLRGQCYTLDLNAGEQAGVIWLLAGITSLPNLECLTIGGGSTNDVGLLNFVPSLKELRWSGDALTDETLDSLRVPASLHTLSLDSFRVSDAAISRFRARHPGVTVDTRYFLSDNQRTIDGIASRRDTRAANLSWLEGHVVLDPLARLPGLNSIELSVSYRDARWELTKELPSVRRLKLEGRGLADRDLLKLRFFPAVEDLELDETSISDRGLQWIARSRQLRRLCVRGFFYDPDGDLRFAQGAFSRSDRMRPWITGPGLAILANCPRLELLDFRGSRITGEGLSALVDLPRLRMLHLAETLVGDADCETLGQMRKLESLDLRSTPLTDVGLARLADSPSLTRLDVRDTGVTATGLRELARCATLRTLIVNEEILAASAAMELIPGRPDLVISPDASTKTDRRGGFDSVGMRKGS